MTYAKFCRSFFDKSMKWDDCINKPIFHHKKKNAIQTSLKFQRIVSKYLKYYEVNISATKNIPFRINYQLQAVLNKKVYLFIIVH